MAAKSSADKYKLRSWRPSTAWTINKEVYLYKSIRVFNVYNMIGLYMMISRILE